MGDGADMRVDRDAAVEDRQCRRLAVTYLADQLDADLDGVLLARAPGEVGLADRIDETDGPDRPEIDRDHPAHRPRSGDGALRRVREGGDGGARAVALDDVAEDAFVVLSRVATLLRRRFAAGFVACKHGPVPRPAVTKIYPGRG